MLPSDSSGKFKDVQYYVKKITSFFSPDFVSVFVQRLPGKILSFDFYLKAVYVLDFIVCHYINSRSKLTEWTSEGNGSREK